MEQAISAPLFAGAMLVGMLLFTELGLRLRRRQIAAIDASGGQSSTIDGAVFALFGLLLAFAFSGSASRFHDRQMLGAEEANAIGTAYLRLDLLPEAQQPRARELFRAYLDSRLETVRGDPSLELVRQRLARSAELQNEIWRLAVPAVGGERTGSLGVLVLTPLNEMFDIVTTRTMAAQLHPPLPLFGLLFTLALACAFLSGWSLTPPRDWIHYFGFPLAAAITVFLIVDMEFPRQGFIRLDPYDQVLIELRASMNE